MLDIPQNHSGIFLLKSKFFLYRIITYFFFLLIPLWIPKLAGLNLALKTLFVTLYILFIIGQWFLLGKEIDHRLKIYFRVNSSIDRILYRFFLGMSIFSLYFNLLSLLPDNWMSGAFWTTWTLLGLFYSWPTRGKIIKESVTSNFSEFKYLDSFEKTLVILISATFLFSIPEFPSLSDKEALKLFFNNGGNFSPLLWNFLTVNYFPFIKYPMLLKISWCMHFYIAGVGLFLITFYTLSRIFLSRRLSLLGVFLLISSSTFTKILMLRYNDTLSTTYSLIWIWSILWTSKNASYKAGLFSGLVGFIGVLINPTYGLLAIIQTLIIYFYFLKNKTIWFRNQFLKYSSLGLILTGLTLLTHLDSFNEIKSLSLDYFEEFISIVNKKAFNILAIFGLAILLIKRFSSKIRAINEFNFDIQQMGYIGILIFALFAYALIFEHQLVRGFSIIWPIALLSLIPLELLFQSISKLRSSRNMIYLTYILICLLDSHLDGRIKNFLKLFDKT